MSRQIDCKNGMETGDNSIVDEEIAIAIVNNSNSISSSLVILLLAS